MSTAVSAVCVCMIGATDVTVTVSDVLPGLEPTEFQAVLHVHHDVLLNRGFKVRCGRADRIVPGLDWREEIVAAGVGLGLQHQAGTVAVSVTSAFGMAAPVESVTTPIIAPWSALGGRLGALEYCDQKPDQAGACKARHSPD